MQMPNKITQEQIIDAVKRSMFGMDNPGFCIKCGAEVEGVEPDAEKYECECCGENGVYGAEQLMFLTF
jgi:hypothetical protein